MKKLLSLALVVLMLFALIACDNGDTQKRIDELEAKLQAQTDKIAALEQDKAQLMDEVFQLEQELGQLEQENDSLREEIADMIDNAPFEIGQFYTLQEAYDNSLLSIAALEEIALYHNNGNGCSDRLYAWVEYMIKQTVVDEYLRQSPAIQASVDGVRILNYYGEYNGCYVVMIQDDYSFVLDDMPAAQEVVGGVTFEYKTTLRIRVWVK